MNNEPQIPASLLWWTGAILGLIAFARYIQVHAGALS